MSPDKSKQSGFGLPMALFVITVLSVIILSMSSIQSSGNKSSALQVNTHRALFATESGIEASLNLLIPPDGSSGQSCATSPFYSQSFNTNGLRNCSVSVSCSVISINDDNVYTLVADGSCGSLHDQASRRLEVKVQ